MLVTLELIPENENQESPKKSLKLSSKQQNFSKIIKFQDILLLIIYEY